MNEPMRCPNRRPDNERQWPTRCCLRLGHIGACKYVVDEEQFGATGEFPEGKLTRDDEGELRIGIGTLSGNVILNFGTPVTWFGLPPQNALELAELLKKHAESLSK